MKKSVKLLLIFFAIVLTGCSAEFKTINSIEDLNSSKIGVSMGSEYDTIAYDYIQNANVAYYNSYSDQISALKSGKIDAFLTDEPLSVEILKENDGLKVLDESLTEDSYAFAIDPDKEYLKLEIDSVLEEMIDEGILLELQEKWLGDIDEDKVLEEYNYEAVNGTIKFATVSGSAPFAYMKNNEIVGYDIDVINYVGYVLGYEIEIVEMAFEGMIAAISSGKVDVAGCSIIVTEEREKSVLFSIPNYSGGIVLIVRE